MSCSIYPRVNILPEVHANNILFTQCMEGFYAFSGAITSKLRRASHYTSPDFFLLKGPKGFHYNTFIHLYYLDVSF